MNKTLFAKELRASAFTFIIVAAVLAMYVVTIVAMFDPELGESLDAMMASMPDLFAAFGMAQPSSTLLDFQLNYLYGFLLNMFPLVLILVMVNKLIVRYVERGAMAYLLATPVSRVRIACTQAGVLVVALVLLVVVVGVIQIATSEFMFPGDLDVEGLLRANVGLLGLLLALAGLCFLSACLFSNAAMALWVGGGICIASFLVQMISQVGDKFEWLQNTTPLALFDAYGLAANESAAWGEVGILYAATVVLFAAAVLVFNRRDLSV